MKQTIILATALAIAGASAQAATLLVNGDFEAGNTGFTTELTYSPTGGSGAAQYDVDTNPNDWFGSFARYDDHTSGSGNMMMVNGSRTRFDIVWSQTVSVLEESAYDFGGWISAMYPGSSVLTLAINGATVGTINGPSTTATWQEFTFGWASGTATSATISLLQGTTAFGGNDYALDDLSFVGVDAGPGIPVVPLPASLPLMLAGIGGIAALRRRRQKR